MNETWFIRHGQSEANAGLRTGTGRSSGLTALGLSQAQAVAEAIADQPARLVSSPLLRARQTAAPTCAKFPALPLEEWPVQEFNYLDNETYSETTRLERKPKVAEYWRRGDPHYRDGQDAETFAELFARVEQTLALIARQRGLTVVFSHGQLMRAIAWRTFGDFKNPDHQAMRSFARFRHAISVPNGAILRLRHEPDGSLWLSDLSTAHLPPELLSW